MADDPLSQEDLDALIESLSPAGEQTESTPSAHVAPRTRIEVSDALISQEEIDALLSELADRSTPTLDADRHRDDVATPYDFSSPALGIRGFVFTLEMVNERFARSYRISLFNLLRHYGEITLQGIRVLKFGEYANALSTPISVNLFRVKPIGGTALMIIEPQLISTVVEVFFGGGRFRTQFEKHEFTPAESRVIQLMVERALKDLTDAWSPVMPLDFEYLRAETNPHYASVISAGEMVVVTIFHVALDGIGGELHVSFPYSMLEPLRESLTAPIQSKGLEVDQEFSSALREGIKEAEVEVSCTLAETDITIGDLVKLKPGDIIPINLPEKVVLQAEHVPVYVGHHGVAEGNWAIKVTDLAKHR